MTPTREKLAEVVRLAATLRQSGTGIASEQIVACVELDRMRDAIDGGKRMLDVLEQALKDAERRVSEL